MEINVTILNDEGLHARPAGIFVKKASEFTSAIEVRSNGVTKNAKSIMGLLSLGLAKGAQITIAAQGADAGPAVEALARLVDNRFVLE